MVLKNVTVHSSKGKFSVNAFEFEKIIFGDKSANVNIAINGAIKKAVDWKQIFINREFDIYSGYAIINGSVTI